MEAIGRTPKNYPRLEHFLKNLGLRLSSETVDGARVYRVTTPIASKPAHAVTTQPATLEFRELRERKVDLLLGGCFRCLSWTMTLMSKSFSRTGFFTMPLRRSRGRTGPMVLIFNVVVLLSPHSRFHPLPQASLEFD
jgi:hypothetical protein